MNDFLLLEDDEELSKELIRNTNLLEKDLEKLEIKMLLSGKFDRNNAIITLHPRCSEEQNRKTGFKCFIGCTQGGLQTMDTL